MFSRPSFTAIGSAIFLAYMANSLWSIASLYLPPTCEKNCLKNGLLHTPDFEPGLRFVLLSTENPRPQSEKEMSYITAFDVTNIESDFNQEVTVKANKNVLKRNATQYLAIFTLPIDPKIGLDKAKTKYKSLMRSNKAIFSITPLTKHHIPEAETFQLLKGQEETVKSEKVEHRLPILHLKSKIKMGGMIDDIDIPKDNVPGEVYHLLKINQEEKKSYLPMIFIDELSMRLKDLVKINKTDEQVTFNVEYSPTSFGKLRLFNQFQSSLGGLHGLGFTEKDTDEVKGIFADTNLVLLLVTFGVSAVHLLFDCLAFKNDISFWRNRETMEGLSTTTLLWRAFSQSIIFLYLWDEETSLLVLIPSGIAALIEMWKVTKAYRVKWVKPEGSWFYRPSLGTKQSQAEEMTDAYDSESLKYLSYFLYPLCICGAFYSLFYNPHKSWYSWTISSLVNGVYAFGFIFMLPQLFVNYKLKSVAHLPWRSFMYKAFNTFIDDLFAFIITMPTAHRVACFRDDLVFFIYLYQRYLYPVDKNRIDMSGMIEETPDEVSDQVPAKETGVVKEKKE